MRRFARAGCVVGLSATLLVAGGSGLQNAVANGDTRTLSFRHTHTGETLTVTFKRDGRYDPAALAQINHFLRDWRNDEPTKMDPRLFDVVWEVYRDVDASQAIQIVSAYRSPKTNSMLRARSRGVAEFSQHMLGKAMDFFIPGVDLARIRAAGLRLQRGGVGFYPTSGSPFVHLDVGGVRYWPRMSRDQLARVFPDGKTVHLPADGKPMPGYQQALAEIEKRGSEPGGASATYASNAYGTKTPGIKNLFASIFNKDSGDDEEAAPQVRGKTYQAVATADGETNASAPDAPAAAAPVAAAVPAVVSTPMPMPQARPVQIAGLAPQTVAPLPQVAAAAAVASQMSTMPMPRPRPGEAQPAPMPTVVASLGPIPLPMPSPQRPSQTAGLPPLITHGSQGADNAGLMAYATTGDVDSMTGAPARQNVPARTAGRSEPIRPTPIDPRQIARLFDSPTLSSEMTLREPEMRVFAAFMVQPSVAVGRGFSRDNGDRPDTSRFSGAAVVAVPMVRFASINRVTLR